MFLVLSLFLISVARFFRSLRNRTPADVWMFAYFFCYFDYCDADLVYRGFNLDEERYYFAFYKPHTINGLAK